MLFGANVSMKLLAMKQWCIHVIRCRETTIFLSSRKIANSLFVIAIVIKIEMKWLQLVKKMFNDCVKYNVAF